MAKNLETLLVLLPEHELKELSKTISAHETPLWQHWAEFVEEHIELGRSIKTVESVRDALRTILRKTPLTTIDRMNSPRQAQAALLAFKRERIMQGSTYNTYRKNINTYLIWLEAKEYIGENKMRKVGKYKEVINEQFTPNNDQVQAVMLHIHDTGKTALEKSRNRLFVLIIILTGARLCEMLDLREIDFDSGKKVITINGRKQKGKPRRYPLSQKIIEAYEIYSYWKKHCGRGDEPKLFVSLSKRTGWTEKGVRNLLRKLSAKVGFRVQCHGFRRYVATKMDENSNDLKSIMHYLGHTRPGTTARYIENSARQNQEGTDIMKKFMGE